MTKEGMAGVQDAKPRKLGKGLSSLVGLNPAPVMVAAPDAAPTPSAIAPQTTPASATDGVSERVLSDVVRILVGLIVPSPFQPRKQVDEAGVAGLAESIKHSGLMQPIIVRRRGSQFELVAGERRWRAASLAGLESIPALVRDLSDEQAAEWALVENIQREDLNPMDRAFALRAMSDRFTLTQDELSRRVGLERSSVANLLRLTELEPAIADLIAKGTLSQGHGKALLAVPAGEKRERLAKLAAMMHWSVRRMEQEASAAAKKPGKAVGEDTSPRAAVLRDLERQIGEHLGTKVAIVTDRQGKRGRLMIDFYGLDHFEDLLTRLGVHTSQ
ncbi:MAG: ParB/RepB/Spo0J family partition protein [Phycisphaerales bacterium]